MGIVYDVPREPSLGHILQGPYPRHLHIAAAHAAAGGEPGHKALVGLGPLLGDVQVALALALIRDQGHGSFHGLPLRVVEPAPGLIVGVGPVSEHILGRVAVILDLIPLRFPVFLFIHHKAAVLPEPERFVPVRAGEGHGRSGRVGGGGLGPAPDHIVVLHLV